MAGDFIRCTEALIFCMPVVWHCVMVHGDMYHYFACELSVSHFRVFHKHSTSPYPFSSVSIKRHDPAHSLFVASPLSQSPVLPHFRPPDTVTTTSQDTSLTDLRVQEAVIF
jgi:hypothetical protein